MQKYKVEVQKITEGYMYVWANNEDEAKDFAQNIVSDECFVPECMEWEVARFMQPTPVDENPNADLWR
jgi:hypothetical protein